VDDRVDAVDGTRARRRVAQVAHDDLGAPLAQRLGPGRVADEDADRVAASQ
jgi:hypothetical protein